MNRHTIITELFETMEVAKRSLHGHMQHMLSDCNISRPQLELLFTIHHLQPVGFRQLAQKLRLSPGAVSQLADGLDQQALIVRQTDPQDRRRQTVKVSAQGDRLLKSLDKRRRELMEKVARDLSDEELAIWLKIQQKLINEYQAIKQTKGGHNA